MRKIDRLIQRAIALTETIRDTNEDGFIEALGLLPDDYLQQLPGGRIQFDSLQALSDTAVTDWTAEDI